MTLLDTLNPAQRAAVEHPGRAVLVIAGAGSGKTRVLTSRVAFLLERRVPPEAIVAFTFTNRAAREMRERIAAMTGPAAGALWVGTFHATAVRILRREAAALDLPRAFAIYDREDQEALLRQLTRRLGWAEGSYGIAAVLAEIGDAKNALVTPEDFARTAFAAERRRIAECYALYASELRAAGALDFDDLIAETVRLFRNHPEIASRYRARFRHVLVDEYQDTNHAQFRLIQALAGDSGAVFVVGDDDQSIYGWRGADLGNVLDFETAFAGAAVVRLEQNYRSTGNILDAANAVIANNRARKGKTLWSERGAGAPIRFALAADEVDEARRVREFIAARVARGSRLDGCAVLYRTNAQSRALETELRHALIPYQVVGGVSFYQRREVKDLIAYLRVAANPADAAAFWRIWNTPRRGLGAGVRAAVEQRAAAAGECAPVALKALVAGEAIAPAARRGAAALLGLLDELESLLDAPVARSLERVLERTAYLDFLGGDHEAADRRANVEELLAAAATFAGDAGGSVTDFLAEAALVTDADRLGERGDRVLLLTGHNAKGLEFPAVAIIGLEEGLFPHASSLEQGKRLEEERRLFYVALTRARDEVLLCAAAFRRRFDGARGGRVSRFVEEIPAALLEREDRRRFEPARATEPGRARDGSRWSERVRDLWDKPRSRWDEGHEPEPDPAWDDDVIAPGTPLKVSPGARARRRAGQRVHHEDFGNGVIVSAEPAGDDCKYTVRFGTRIKKVMGRFLSGAAGNGS